MAQHVAASTWVATQAIRGHRFELKQNSSLTPSPGHDGWSLHGLPGLYTCDTPSTAYHAMTCKTEAFVFMIHDEVRDLTTQMLTEVS